MRVSRPLGLAVAIAAAFVTALSTGAEGRLVELRRGELAPAPDPEHATVTFRAVGSFDPRADGEVLLDPSLEAAPLAPGTIGGHVVQIAHPVRPGEREEIEAAGAAVFAYVPEYAFIVRAGVEAAAAIDALPFVRWVGRYHGAYKIDAKTRVPEGTGVAIVVLLFPDADASEVADAIDDVGGSVADVSVTVFNKIVRANVDGSLVETIAAREDVAWIEPWYDVVLDNSQAQWVTQSGSLNNRTVWARGIRGEGQVVHMSDSGIRTSHFAFRDDDVSITTFGQYPDHRKVIAYEAGSAGVVFGDSGGASNHGTHTAGTVAGNDGPYANDLRDGMAPEAKIYFHDIGNTSNSVFPPGDLTTMFAPAYAGNAGGAARFSSNSWSSTISAGAYTTYSRACDQFMWANRDFLIHCSNGNLIAPHTVAAPATNKNGIGSGATRNGGNSNLMMEQSSQGPTEDGRLKPTVVAPGQSISSADGSGDSGYKSLTGTSMSCPATAGSSALVREYYVDGWFPSGFATPSDGFNPSAALVKATLIASTDNDMTGLPIPNNTVGWGRINLENVLYFDGDDRDLAVVDEGTPLSTDEFVELGFETTEMASLRIALCWTDWQGNPSTTIQLVNDLDLAVTDETLGITYLGNVVSSGQSVPGGVADQLNVEEVVRFETATPATWTVRITGKNVPMGPQPYALVVSGPLADVLLGVDTQMDPSVMQLAPVSPNPAFGSPVFRFHLDGAREITLSIFDVAGRHVRTLVDGIRPAGAGSVAWDGRDAHARPVESGVYTYRLRTGPHELTRKLTYVR